MKLSIRWVILLGSIALVWGTHLIITPSSYIISEKVLTEHMLDIMENIADLTLEQSYNHLSKAQSATFLTRQLLNSRVISSDREGIDSLERYFFDQLSIYPHLAGIYVGGLDGDFIMVCRHAKHAPDGFRTKIITHAPEGRKVVLMWRDANFNLVEKLESPEDPYDPRTRPWFTKVMEQKRVCWTDPYIFYTAQKPGVTIAGPSFNNDGTLRGIVGVDVEISELSTFMSKMRVGKSGRAFIINENGDMIAIRDIDKLIVPVKKNGSLRLPKISELHDPLTREAFTSIQWKHDTSDNLQLEHTQFSTFIHEGRKYHSMFSPFPGKRLPWIIGVYLPENDYLGLIKLNRTFSIIATVIISLLASFVALVLARKIIYPVEIMASEAKAIEKHEMKTTFDIESNFKELQEAADAFARMKTSLVNYEGRLHESKSVYRAIAKTANDAIIMMDQDHCISYLNPAAERMFGYKESQARGMNLHKLLAPRRYLPHFENGLAKFSMTGRGPYIDRPVNVTAMNRFGMEFPVELSLSSLQIDGKWHAVAIIRNISERKKAEQLRKRLADDLHDGLGGSLTNIKLFAEMTKTHQEDDHTRRNLDAIAEICEDCLLEIRNYMNVLDEIEPRWEALVLELKQYCLRTLEPHEIKFSMTSDITPDALPPSRLLYINMQKIVKEAVTNVIKHSDGDAMHIAFHVAMDRLMCIISDNGTAAHTTKSTGRGLLSMTSRAKEMGGALDISWDSGVIIILDVPFL